MKNITTQRLFQVASKFFAKYGQAAQQTYSVSSMDDKGNVGQEIGTVQGLAHDWDAAADLAAQKFFQATKAERMAGTSSGPFYVPEAKQQFYLE